MHTIVCFTVHLQFTWFNAKNAEAKGMVQALGRFVVFTDDQIQLFQTLNVSSVGKRSGQQSLSNTAALKAGCHVQPPDQPFVACFGQFFLSQSHCPNEFPFIIEGTEKLTTNILEVLDITCFKISRELLQCLRH